MHVRFAILKETKNEFCEKNNQIINDVARYMRNSTTGINGDRIGIYTPANNTQDRFELEYDRDSVRKFTK